MRDCSNAPQPRLKDHKVTLIYVMSYGTGLAALLKTGQLSRLVTIIREFSKHYDEVIIFTYDSCDITARVASLLPSNVKLFCRPAWLDKKVYSLLGPLCLALRVGGSGLIRTEQLWGSWVALILKFLTGYRLVIRQGFQFSTFVLKAGRRVLYALASLVEAVTYRLADAIIVTTPRDREYIIRRYNVRPGKVIVVPNWVNTRLFRPLKDFPKKRGLVVFVGRLERQKNVLSLIEAVAGLEGVELRLYGKGSLEPLVKQAAERAGNVKLMGVVPHVELPYRLNEAEVFVLPSLYEGHPKALIEAMACGLPVVASDVEGIRELIRDGYNGVLCKPTPSCIREKILLLLSNDSLRRRLGRAAREFVEKEFSVEGVMRRELMVHRALLGGGLQ